MNWTIALILTATAAMPADGRRNPPLLQRGGDPARGILVNHSTGARPFDPPNPALATIVFIHGINPAPRLVHFTMSEQVAESIRRRGGPPVNVLGWDWNASTLAGLRSEVNSEAAVRQGGMLAQTLWGAGIDPARTHLIGHSAGGMVATSAAWIFAKRLGRPVARLTLLEPATFYHAVIFERLEAGSLASIVENYWSPGPSAFGREVALPGVRDYRVEGTSRYVGVIRPLRSDHLGIVHWYLGAIERPDGPVGDHPGPGSILMTSTHRSPPEQRPLSRIFRARTRRS